jgi:tetrahydromethanopterin S-methyltransferase subunit H
MFSFTHEQTIIDVSGMPFGGQPGFNPTVLFGGLFFRGNPDFDAAKTQLQTMYMLSKKTSVPVITDFFIRKEDYIEEILTFIQRVIPKNQPFSVDITDPGVKVKVLEQLHEKKLLKRTIYNSIHVGITPEEKTALTRYRPEAAILVAFNPKDKSPDGKIEVLENGAHLTEHGLFAIARDIGIEKLLVDTAALAPGDNSGAAIAALPVIKEEYGLPTGCAIHNVVEKSRWLDMFPDARKPVDAASNMNIPLFGGDFAIFGPVAHADIVIPLIAWQDILVSEYTENYFGITPSDHHPRRTLSK